MPYKIILNVRKFLQPTASRFIVFLNDFKVIGIRPMAPVLNTGPLKVSQHEMLIFSIRKEIIKNNNSLVVILLSTVVENEFLQTL